MNMEVNKKIGVFTKILIIPLVIALTSTAGLAASVNIRWDANVPAPEGYRVFVREAGRPYDYSQPVWEGNDLACTLPDLDDQTLYFFVVRAFEGGVESIDSDEVHFALPNVDGDADTMPDLWEVEYNLDYMIDDADGDADGDGISNRDEYRTGLEPDNIGTGMSPDAPVAFYPDPDAEAETNTLLELEDYSDHDGDANISTQWQIYDVQTGVCLMDAITDQHLTLLPLPTLLLAGNETYRWRARFYDSGGLASDWSADSDLRTQAALDGDESTEIPTDQEVNAVRAEVNRSLVSPAVSSEPTALEIDGMDNGSTIARVALLDPAGFDAHENTPPALPSAMLAYKLALDQPGQRVAVTIHLSATAPAGAQWVGYDPIQGWKPYDDQAVFSGDLKSVTIELQDGGFGDADGIANGFILDTAGLSPADEASDAVPDASGVDEGGAGGGGGCFLAAAEFLPQDGALIRLESWRRVAGWLALRFGFDGIDA